MKRNVPLYGLQRGEVAGKSPVRGGDDHLGRSVENGKLKTALTAISVIPKRTFRSIRVEPRLIPSLYREGFFIYL
jgi:hypothetical protein